MTGLENLLIDLPHFILPKLPPLAIRSLLLTSDRIYTLLSPSMETIYQAQFPNEPVHPNTNKNDSYWTRRFLTRTGTSQVYGWGYNGKNILCLGMNRKNGKNFNNKYVYWPRRSEFLSRLGVKKFMHKDNFSVALCMDGNVYIIATGYGKREPKALESNHPNEFFMDVAVAEDRIIARSNTERLYISYSNSLDRPLSPNKLVEFDLGCALGLPNKPRILAMTQYSSQSFACLVEDVGVVELRYGYSYAGPTEVDIVPVFSNSHEPGCDVVDMASGWGFFVIVLGNGLVKVFEIDREVLEIYEEPSPHSPEPLNFPEPIERVWCTWEKIWALSRTKVLFLVDRGYIYEGHRRNTFGHNFYDEEPKKFEGIDTAHLSNVHGHHDNNIALMDDGTLYVWGRTNNENSNVVYGRGPHKSSKDFFEPVKMDLEHVVYVATYLNGLYLAIVVDPNEPGDAEAASD